MSSVSSLRAAQEAEDAAVARKKALRRAFGAFTTGVTVVTTRDGTGRPLGFTANSFTSVSLEPPLLLICLAKSSSSIEAFTATDSFAVNILAADQQEISTRFASPLSDRFAGVEWQEGCAQLPLIGGAAAWFCCARHETVDAGDHLILIGRIETFDATGAAPLVFLQGQYRALAPIPAAPRGMSGIRVGVVALRDGRVLLCRDEAGGWELPLGPAQPLFGAARAACEAQLSDLGARVSITHPYSIYDDGEKGESRFFFMAELGADAVLPDRMELFAPDDLPVDLVRDIGMRDVLQRHGREQQDGSFGVYVERDREPGRISRMTGECERWSDALRPTA